MASVARWLNWFAALEKMVSRLRPIIDPRWTAITERQSGLRVTPYWPLEKLSITRDDGHKAGEVADMVEVVIANTSPSAALIMEMSLKWLRVVVNGELESRYVERCYESSVSDE